jgi:hypothetical protein
MSPLYERKGAKYVPTIQTILADESDRRKRLSTFRTNLARLKRMETYTDSDKTLICQYRLIIDEEERLIPGANEGTAANPSGRSPRHDPTGGVAARVSSSAPGAAAAAAFLATTRIAAAGGPGPSTEQTEPTRRRRIYHGAPR